MKLSHLGIRLNIASTGGTGTPLISKFKNYSYWMDGDEQIVGKQIMIIEVWVNNRRILRAFQNSQSRLLFCEVNSWPSEGKKQITMADFCEEGYTIPSGSVREVYEFLINFFESAAELYSKPGRIRNVIKKMRHYEDLDFGNSVDQFK